MLEVEPEEPDCPDHLAVLDQFDSPPDRNASGIALLEPLKRRLRFRQRREGRHAMVTSDLGVSDDGQYGRCITRARRAEAEALRNQFRETAWPCDLQRPSVHRPRHHHTGTRPIRYNESSHVLSAQRAGSYEGREQLANPIAARRSWARGASKA